MTGKHTQAYGSLPSGIYSHPLPSVSRADSRLWIQGNLMIYCFRSPYPAILHLWRERRHVLKHLGPKGTHTICWITGNAVPSSMELWLPRPAGRLGLWGADQGNHERELPTLCGSAEEEELHTCAFRARQHSVPTTVRTSSICALNWSVLGRCWTQFRSSLPKRSPTGEALYMICFLLFLAVCWWQENM